MIPKVIHYCWFGRNSLPPLAMKCINSWRRYLPDYEIKEWNENNFDVNIIPYTREAYEARKYAFVSDYARFWILYNYGGLYFDTDVEIIKPMDRIIANGPFMGCETNVSVAPGLGLGAVSGMAVYKMMLDLYQNMHFHNQDGSLNLETIVSYTTNLFEQYGFNVADKIQTIEGIVIYPKEYFCPIDYQTQKMVITDNTVSIHHYAASWFTWKHRLYWFVKHHMGERVASWFSSLYNHILSIK